MAGHGEVLLPTKPQGCHRRAFPDFQPRDLSRCQPSRHLGAARHTRTSLFDSWYQGCFPYVKISHNTTPRLQTSLSVVNFLYMMLSGGIQRMGSIVWPPTWQKRGKQDGISHLETQFLSSGGKVWKGDGVHFPPFLYLYLLILTLSGIREIQFVYPLKQQRQRAKSGQGNFSHTVCNSLSQNYIGAEIVIGWIFILYKTQTHILSI